MISENIVKKGSWEQQLEEFGAFLEWEQSVPDVVLFRALEDERYAQYLISVKGNNEKLSMLFNHPDTKKFEGKRPKKDKPKNLELVGKATKALVKWGKAGFKLVEDEVLERRENACLSCPNLVAPQKMLQKIISLGKAKDQIGKRTRDSVCGLCGCGVAKKIKLPTESCPGEHPNKKGYTRWNEVIK